MASPIPYTRSYSFSDYQANNPSQPLPGPQVDNELENIEQSLGQAIDAVNDVRRADGALVNGIVTMDSLHPAVKAGVGQGAIETLAAALAASEAAANSAVASDGSADASAASATASAGSATAAQGSSNSAATARNAAQNARDDAIVMKNGADAARDFASQWASAPENTDVDDDVNPVGKSAYHWAKAAEATAGGAIPDGAVTEPKLSAEVAAKLNGALRAANDLSDLDDAATALTNLGLVSPGVTGLELLATATPLAARMAANVRGRVNFFDFLQTTRSSAVREQIMNGTFTGDLAVEWQAFRDALASIDSGGGRPYGFIPECKIYSSVAPNFAMDYLTLETQGHVRIEAIGAVAGFVIDGMGLGVNGYGVRHLNIGALCASTITGSAGVRVRRAHKSDFWGFQSLGSAFAGIWVDGCVTSAFYKPIVSPQAEPFIAPPSLGLYISGTDGGAGPEPWRYLIQSSWCKFDMPVMEYTATGIQLDNAYGNIIVGGTAEGCSDTGLVLGAAAEWNKVIGLDLEVNAVRDMDIQGKRNALIEVDSQTIALFRLGDCSRNKIIGGHYNQLTLDASTKRNLVTGASITTLTDSSIGVGRNRVRDITDDAGNWTDRWLSWIPAVTAGSGTITTASASGEYKVRDGDTVDFHIEVLVTTNGSGAVAVLGTVPFNAAINSVFSGQEIITGKGVMASVMAGANVLSIRYADGTYPGADSRRIIVSGTYRRA